MTTNPLFREAVTASHFSLSLSRTQMRTLASIGFGTRAVAGQVIAYPQWCAATQGLARRGLVEIRAPASVSPRYDSPFAEYYQLTRAGELVLELCQIAGLIPVRPPSHDTATSSQERIT